MVCLLVYLSQKDAKAHGNDLHLWFLDGILYILLKYSWKIQNIKLVCPYHEIKKKTMKIYFSFDLNKLSSNFFLKICFGIMTVTLILK